VVRPKSSPSARGREAARPVMAAADAANAASRDAEAAARWAADTSATADSAAKDTEGLVTRARQATATTVAAAASAAAEVAARAAVEVQVKAAARALDVAASAETALERIVADLTDDVDQDDARRVAALVAAMVAADVVAQAQLTDEAAERVARAVALAAESAALAALAAASIVEMAALMAESSAQGVSGSIAATEEASNVAVASASRVAELAQRRVALLVQAPLVAELRRALARDELRLHYQPMRSMETHEVVAVEALIRWQHPTRGLLLPAEFLDVAEGPHLVNLVGDWVLETAVAQAASWRGSMGDRAPTMWVNISCDQLGRSHLVHLVERLLSAAGLPPWSLGIEVTERNLARRADDVAADLMALRSLGVGLAVDDFGTGFASLDYLRRFNFDEIKIDRSFVSGLPDPTDTAITSSIIALGRSLGLTVVAEGVETRAQYDHLKRLGCTVGQGHLFHRPVPAEALDDLFAVSTP